MPSHDPAPAGLREAILSLGQELRRPIVVLAGAAVSKASGLPIANDFLTWLAGSKRLGLPDVTATRLIKEKVAFELVMDELRQVLSDDRASSVVELLESVYGAGRPNEHHRTLAAMLGAGEIVGLLTTNFDVLLEGDELDRLQTIDDGPGFAAAAEQVRTEGTIRGVVHLHGSVRDVGELDAYMSRVARPVTDERRTLINSLLDAGFGFVCVGYSGSDVDLVPVLSPGKLIKDNDRLGRTSHSEPDGPRVRHVDLGSEPRTRHRAREAIQDWTNALSDANADRVAGVIAQRARDLPSARLRYLKALRASPSSPSTTLALATAFADQHLSGHAVTVLADPPPSDDPRYIRWMAFRGLLRRLRGDERTAICDFDAMAAALPIHRANSDVRAVLVMAICQEVEARVIVASTKPARRQRDDMAACRRRLRVARRLVAEGGAPEHDIWFYRAEVAMLGRDWACAALLYRRFRNEVIRWRPGPGGEVGRARIIAALAFSGRRSEAAEELRSLLLQDGSIRWLAYPSIHGVGAAVAGLIGRPWLYWWMRRRPAPLLYRGVEVATVLRLIVDGHRASLVTSPREERRSVS